MKTATKEKLEIRHPLNTACKMDLAKMKTGVSSQQPWIKIQPFLMLPVAIRPAFQLLWSAARFLLALPSTLLVRILICIFPWLLSASVWVRAAAGERCQQRPRAATCSVLTVLLRKPLILSMVVAAASGDGRGKNSCECSAVLSAIFSRVDCLSSAVQEAWLAPVSVPSVLVYWQMSTLHLLQASLSLAQGR